jgi:ADP-ribosyl-[dinitrogen reductase] hydrolase
VANADCAKCDLCRRKCNVAEQGSATITTTARLSRAEACLLGHLAGDALGSLVEFESAAHIAAHHRDGPRELASSPRWHTLPGQPTDDGEMMLALAHAIADHGDYEPAAAMAAYRRWGQSDPFDRGNTITSALAGRTSTTSQANGALMRAAPLGLLGARRGADHAAACARRDAELTHPHPVCVQANAIYVRALSCAVDEGVSGPDLYERVLAWTAAEVTEPTLRDVIIAAADGPPPEFMDSMGWVLIALRNALWQLVREPSFEEALVDTVCRGGDTDTNAAICGALLGAVYGLQQVPTRWLAVLTSCRADQGGPGDNTYRPREYWPEGAAAVARRIMGGTA